ncbi:MAG: hypothetical protein H8E19_07460 [Deltaproteobacteria bacterium]|uniref:Uncharacterized protein n=1 Tax=Candidatus Desulfacyla euxinica TaxID=2841693 RepID=A0A8J6N077_9DELT|nr:hypothetical protein [Candidatus Desulfacyla euxinica]
MEETMDMTTYTGNLPKIPDEVLEKITDEAEDVCLWAKPQPGGFLVGDDTHPVISGIISNVDPYHVKWVDNLPDKLHVPPGQDPPADYEPRCDIRVLTPEGIEIGVSLAKSSYLYSFAPYVKGLRGMGLQPTDVVTRLTCKEVNGQYGTFTTVRFSMLSKKDNAIPVEELPPTEYDERGDRIPY